MPDKSLQARNMRKTVERVDIGVFGAPMRASTWLKKKKSSWSGWAMVTGAQALVGALIGAIACALFGATTLASVLIVVGFALGSAIGGPISFLAWSIVLLGLTHILGGLIAGAWIASPAWWSDLGRQWDAGQPIPGWMKIAVPAWALLWIAAARGMAKVADMLFDKLSLRLGFRAAKNYSGEERNVFDEAFERSDVSQAETRSLLESSGDGTHAVIAGEPSKMGGLSGGHMREMGGDPDVSSVPLPTTASGDGIDYDSFLSIGDDPDVLKAVGRKPSGLMALPTESDDEEIVPVPNAASAVVIEMEPLNLPAVPKDTSPPLQRVEAPKLDPRQNRALFRRMTQLNLAFQSARREDMDAEFIDKHQEELALVSDEQRMILESMNDTGPLLALIHTIQEKRTEEFLVGLAPVPVAPGTGSLEAAPDASVSHDDVPFDIDPVVPIATTQTTPVEASQPQTAQVAVAEEPATVDEEERPTQTVRPRPDIASMAASLSQALSVRKIVDASVPATDETQRTGGDDALETASEDAVPGAPAKVDAVADATNAADEPTAEMGASDVSIVDVVGDAHAIDATDDAGADDDGGDVTSAIEAGPSLDDADEIRADGGMDADRETPTVFSEAEADVVSAVEVNNEQPAQPDGDSQDASLEPIPEEEMTGRSFSRSMCRQVLGLVVGPLDAVAKADDVVQFERDNAGIRVAEVINSRSFDEHVGPQEAAAARHAWKDVSAVLSQSGVERLISEFEKLNARGQVLLEQPFALTTISFNAFEADCMRLRRMVSMPSETDAFEATADLVDRNVAILDSLADIHKTRQEAAANMSTTTPGGIVRKRVPSGNEEAHATRGRSLIGSVLGGARFAGVGVMRDGAAVDLIDDVEGVAGGADEMSAAGAAPALVMDAASNGPSIGTEGFVSRHPIDSVDYKVEMEMHEAGLRARAVVSEAAAEQAKAEEAHVDAVRIDQEAADRRRDALEQSTRENDEAERAQRNAEAVHNLEHQKELDRLEIARVEDELVRSRADTEASQLRLENERVAAARTKEDEAIIRQFHERRQQMDIPERFRTDVIVAHSLALTELRNIRRLFQTSAIQDKITGLSPVEAALRVPAARSQFQTDAEMVKDSAAILAAVAALLDVPDPEDVEAIRGLLAEDEVKFFSGVIDQINRGRVARETLDQANEADRLIRQQAEKASGVDALERSVAEAAAELARLRDDLQLANDRAQAAEAAAQQERREAQEARDALDALQKERAGIVDDDFQHLLDARARRLEVSDIEGFYSFLSPDHMSMVVVMTTPSGMFPDGTIQRGSKAVTIAEVLELVIARAKDVFTDDIAVFYTDPMMRAYVNSIQGVTMRQIGRSSEELANLLSNYNIAVEEDK